MLGGLDPLVAGLVFGGHEMVYGPATSKVSVRSDDPRLAGFAILGRTLGRHSHFWWGYRCTYSGVEIARAELFNLNVTTPWWPGPEAFGTEYDYSNACHIGRPIEKSLTFDAWWPYTIDGSEQCGGGRVQVSRDYVRLRTLQVLAAPLGVVPAGVIGRVIKVGQLEHWWSFGGSTPRFQSISPIRLWRCLTHVHRFSTKCGGQAARTLQVA